MKRFASAAALSLATALTLGGALASPALAQQASPVPVLESGHSLLTVSAEGRSTRTPDLAVFSAGVTTQGKSAAEALSENSRAMTQVVASLKRAGIADRDIQTSNLSINPIYSNPERDAQLAGVFALTKHRGGKNGGKDGSEQVVTAIHDGTPCG